MQLAKVKRNRTDFALGQGKLFRSNIPPWEGEIFPSRNEPLGARNFQDRRRDSICEWPIPAHRVFGNVGSDVVLNSLRKGVVYWRSVTSNQYYVYLILSSVCLFLAAYNVPHGRAGHFCQDHIKPHPPRNASTQEGEKALK
jgi:hypothetical protein